MGWRLNMNVKGDIGRCQTLKFIKPLALLYWISIKYHNHKLPCLRLKPDELEIWFFFSFLQVMFGVQPALLKDPSIKQRDIFKIDPFSPFQSHLKCQLSVCKMLNIHPKTKPVWYVIWKGSDWGTRTILIYMHLHVNYMYGIICSS